MNRYRLMLALVATITMSAVSAFALEPYFYISFNVPKLIKSIEDSAPPEARADPAFNATFAPYKKARIKSATIYFYPDKKYQTLPVIVISGSDKNALKSLLVRTGPIAPFLEPVPGKKKTYRIKADAVPQPPPDADAANELPTEDYRIWFIGTKAIFGPTSVARSWKAQKTSPDKSEVAKVATTVQGPSDIVTIALNLPDKVDWSWIDDIKDNPALKGNPGAAASTGMVTGQIGGLKDPLSTIKSLAIAFQMKGSTDRSLKYTQKFRPGVNGKKISDSIKGGQIDDSTSMLLQGLLAATEAEGITKTTSFTKDKLTIKLRWKKDADQAIGEAVMGPIMGMMMGGAMQGGNMGQGMGDFEDDDVPLEEDEF